MTKYVAFLRGINSGNVLFESSTDENILEQKLEEVLPVSIGFHSDVIIRTIDDLHKLVLLNPFKATEITTRIRLYVTFIKGETKTNLKFPAVGKGYTILGIFNGVVCSVVDLSDAKTPSLMQLLDKEFGKGITTRSWNTVERILKAS
jgi:uncharacterized protein (DUF1697 family)